MTTDHSGITLWRILAVFALLLIFAAVLAPFFQKVPGVSPRASCQSNMKQIGLVMIQYVQDADGKFPPGVNAAGNGWAGQTYSFSKANGLYVCPADPGSTPHVSYAENRNLVQLPQTALADAAVSVECYEFTTPNCAPSAAETVSATGLSALQDSTRHNPQSFGLTFLARNNPQAFGLNFLTADGHVKYLMPGQVSDGPGAAHPKNRAASVLTFAAK